jgi:aspartyl/glutamyl-tRNA(Asn/Gln) amidotransferase C subunit
MAALSYLKVPEEKLDSLTKDMDNILRSVAAMEEVNTDNVEPLLSILEDFSLKTRPDLARPTTENSEDMTTPAESSQQTSDTNVEWGFVEMAEPKILDNAAQREMGFFVVPKQKQPWEEDDTSQLETEDVAPLKEVQRGKQQKASSGEAKRS